MKMLVVFSLTERLRYIGHLDLMRAMQRALRRSGLPLRFSQGFNPHIVLGFAAPLSVGMQGLREVMEVPLSGEVAPKAFVAALNAALPPLIRCQSARSVDDSHKAPMAMLAAASYRLLPLADKEALQEALPRLLQKQSIPAMRKSKKGPVPVDIRPLIYNALVKGDSIEALLAFGEAGTCRPDLFLQALAEEAGLAAAPACDISRSALYADGFVPLEDA